MYYGNAHLYIARWFQPSRHQQQSQPTHSAVTLCARSVQPSAPSCIALCIQYEGDCIQVVEERTLLSFVPQDPTKINERFAENGGCFTDRLTNDDDNDDDSSSLFIAVLQSRVSTARAILNMTMAK